ncbi:MAG TPA: NAD(P)-dependent oxidoreductase [Roseiflexaceae bacterium]|nr:NAD(P)-dependent oxidoreductase [Roseiflexaceae bacterium]
MTGERFLVTGALGCIGAWVVRNLVRAGARPVAFDLVNNPRRMRLIMTPEELGQVTFVTGDITDLASVERALDEHAISHVIHLAALQVPFCKADPALGARVNVVGTVNLFQALAQRRDRIGRLVYASSVAVYDAADAGPGGLAPHGGAGTPTTLYGVYKQANEGTARIFWQDSRVSSIGLRPCVVYGPGRDQGLTSAPTLAMRAAAAGQSYRIGFGGRTDYHYADDVAKMFIAAARAPFSGADIFNLRGSVATMDEMVAAIRDAVPGAQIDYDPVPLPFPEEYDAAPLAELIGPLPVTPLRQAVAETVAVFRAKAE